MKVKEYEDFIKLTADEDKYLYSGHIICKEACVPVNFDYSTWVEISIEEGDKIKAEQKAKEVSDTEEKTED